MHQRIHALYIYRWGVAYCSLTLGMFMDIPTLTELVWPHWPAPLRAPLKVFDTVVSGRFSVLTLDQCGHWCRDVHTNEDRTDTSMLYIYIYIHIYHTILRRVEEKRPPRPKVLIHERSKKKILNSYPWTWASLMFLSKKKKFELKKKLTCVSEATFLSQKTCVRRNSWIVSLLSVSGLV